MKIAMIGHKDYPSRAGGVEVVVSELAPRMVKAGNSVTLYNRGLDSRPNHTVDEKGVELFRVFTVKNSKLNAMLYSFLATVKGIIS